jgi:hypothetical protein
MVINDKLVFIPIPKNASWSVEDTCIDYQVDLKYPNILWENSVKLGLKNKNIHIHTSISYLLDSFGSDYEYVCILRDSTDRFISGWKYFIEAITIICNIDDAKKIKEYDNEFVMTFIKENYEEFSKSFTSPSIRKKLFIKLIDKLNIFEIESISDEFIKKYEMHIFSLMSQHLWIDNDKVNVKKFSFNNLTEFEDYLSKKLNLDFKLIHKNKTKLDYCAVTRTPELVDFVDRYIDGAVKRTKSII